MNLKQLELKRTRELLAACRRARHLAQAMRSPLAKYLRFQKEAIAQWNRALQKLQKVNEETRFELEDKISTEALDDLKTFAENWQSQEKAITKRITALSATKKLNDNRPADERIAERRAKRSKKNKSEATRITKLRETRAALEPYFEQWKKEARGDGDLVYLLQRAWENIANKFDLGFDLSNLRLKGHADWAETIKSLVK